MLFSASKPDPKPMAPASKPDPVPEPVPEVPICQKKVTEDAGFVANIRQSMREFIHTPMDGHKACLKAQYHKFIAKFGGDKEGQNSAPVQTTAKN